MGKMKLLKDLIISRRELQDWDSNLTWGRDGSLFLTTYPELTVCEPVFRRDAGKSSKDLFHVKEYPLPLENKLEFEQAEQNIMLNSQPESFVKRCKLSCVDERLAVLTNNGNVCIFHDQNLLAQLDEPQKPLKQRTYHSFAWSPDGKFVILGNEDSELVIFAINRAREGISFTYNSSIRLDHSSTEWVIEIEWKRNIIAVSLSDNSAYVLNYENFQVQPEPHKIKKPSRFKITDVQVVNENVLLVTTGSLHRFNTKTDSASSVRLESCDEFYIIPIESKNCAILLSNKTSCKINLNGEVSLQPDDVVSPHIESKFKKWNTVFNEFNKYETNFFIHGLSTSPDGSSLALLYNIDRISIKYRIVSEFQYRICFIPLNDAWSIPPETTGLAWYQNYHIYGKSLPKTSESETSTKLDTSMDFASYLLSFLNDNHMNNLRFLNFVEEKQSDELYKYAIFTYAVAKKKEITNPLDKACIQSLANILSKESPVESDVVLFKSDFIAENFDFKKNSDSNVIDSEEGHTWKRCAITFLPLITTKVKVCPVSNQRIIDIRRDSLNDYGWLTGTILEVLNNNSIYSGTKMVPV